MTYSSSGPSLAQAPDVDQPLSSSDSSSSLSSSSNSHSHSHSSAHSSHTRSNSGKRHAHLHRHDSRQVDNTDQDDQDHQQDPSEDQGGSERGIDTVSRLRHSHRRHQFRGAETALKLEIRDETATGYVTQVVQTVSVVQVVDSVGSPIAVQTLYGDPNTIVVDSASGSTISASNPESSTAAAPASNAASTNDVAQSSNDMNSLVASTPAADATSSGTGSAVYLVPTSVSSSGLLSASYSDILNTLQDPAQTPGASGTSINGALNGTNTTPTAGFSSSASSQTSLTDTELYSTPVASSQTTSDTTSDLTSYSVEKNILSTPTTRSLTSSSISSFSSTSTTDTTDLSSTILSSTIYSYSTETWTSTQYADGGGSGDGSATAAEQPADATTTLEASGSSSSGSLTQTQKQVLGGVVGSIAGVAVLALLIMFALKYKKRQGALLGDNQPRPGVKGLITGGDPGSGSGGVMTERAGPFAVAAALAGLTGKRNLSPTDAAPSGERGFYRVSGKKLPSVLQTGGDGYSDPRDSVASGHTDYWRGSQAFDPSSDGSNRLALGSPMRPVSGVPIIRTGPARTPITEENPFGDPVSRPRPDSDIFGDSIGAAGSVNSHDGSHGSPSRFQERI